MELEEQIEVTGNSAAFEIRGVGSNVIRFICKLDGVEMPNCKSFKAQENLWHT